MTKVLLIPVFIQVLLTLSLVLMVARERVAAVKSGAVRMKDVALPSGPWPDRARQLAACYENQLELPTLFYALVALALATGKADALLAAAAWAFVATRLGHAYIHTTSNYVPRRFKLFAAGVTILALAWIYFAARVLLA